jgi:hypothetical protein
MYLRTVVAALPHGAIGPCVPTDENRTKIDLWVALAPDTRVVETTQAGDRWTTQALEDGEVRYEETEFGADEPELNQLAGWVRASSQEAGATATGEDEWRAVVLPTTPTEELTRGRSWRAAAAPPSLERYTR